MTAREYLKANPQKYVLHTAEFGNDIYIAPAVLRGVNITDKASEAEQWSALDNSPNKLAYYRALTGYKELEFKLTD